MLFSYLFLFSNEFLCLQSFVLYKCTWEQWTPSPPPPYRKEMTYQKESKEYIFSQNRKVMLLISVEHYRWLCTNFCDVCLIFLIGDLINMHAICKKLYDGLISSLSSIECSSSYGGSAYEGNTSGTLRMLSKDITIIDLYLSEPFIFSLLFFRLQISYILCRQFPCK